MLQIVFAIMTTAFASVSHASLIYQFSALGPPTSDPRDQTVITGSFSAIDDSLSDGKITCNIFDCELESLDFELRGSIPRGQSPMIYPTFDPRLVRDAYEVYFKFDPANSYMFVYAVLNFRSPDHDTYGFDSLDDYVDGCTRSRGECFLLDIDPTTFVIAPLAAVPLPPTIWLFGTALIGLVGFGKRRPSAAV